MLSLSQLPDIAETVHRFMFTNKIPHRHRKDRNKSLRKKCMWSMNLNLSRKHDGKKDLTDRGLQFSKCGIKTTVSKLLPIY